jgi:choline dehydrogenase
VGNGTTSDGHGEHGGRGPGGPDADFIVVGSGAGGGTVAARLAELGFRVLLLEAGGDPRTSVGSTPQTPGVNSLPDDYDVPAFHAMAAENEGMRWDYFVRHYADDDRQRSDPKHVMKDGKPSVLYPRAGTLGGCTAHNALIFVSPNNADWNQLADLTGDASWRAERMRDYFERIENCEHRDLERAKSKIGHNPSRHGWDGWLQTETAVSDAAFRDEDLRTAIMESARAALSDPDVAVTEADRHARLESKLDPNDWRVVEDDAIGLRYTPLTTKNHRRVGARERVLDVSRRFPDRLKVELHAVATRVLFDEAKRAIGVEYLSGERLYGADPRAGSAGPGTARRAYASREVILSGGAFNTPQLLMLSGIGPQATLEQHGIDVLVDLPGVGQHLQDRYEVAVVNRMKFDAWKALKGATFTRDDSQYADWVDKREGVYDSNGALLAVNARSGPHAFSPDLFLYALAGRFHGYFPGYSSELAKNPNCLTWVVLKSHTNNTAGEVTLRSKDPLAPPLINFRYFDEGSERRADEGSDLASVAAGVKLARRLAATLRAKGLIANEEIPGDAVPDALLPDFVRNNAWGHHASCTCRIGRRQDGGVVSSDFKVHGVERLRIVDASVFPRIPGSFIASAVYMIGEKAADVIAAEAGGAAPAPAPDPDRPRGW